MPRAAVSHKYVSVRNQNDNFEDYLKFSFFLFFFTWTWSDLSCQVWYFTTINNNVKSELARCLEDNDFRGFTDALESAREIDYDLDQNYGKEVGYKTILHLALGEDTM